MGSNYNGVIVVFENWNNNRLVQSLFQEMSSSADGSTKFYYNPYRYWHIKVHQQKLCDAEEPTTIDASLPDKERIDKLETLVKSMSAQIHYMQTRQERSERIMMEYERKETQYHLNNMELRTQLDEKDIQQGWLQDAFDEENEKLRNENETLRCRLGLNSIELTRKEYECHSLKQELWDNKCILKYLENQSRDMQELLTSVSNNDPNKNYINRYIKEYLY
jgi:hypothetical protein